MLGKTFFCNSSDRYDFYGVTKSSANSTQFNNDNTYFVNVGNINSSTNSSAISTPKVSKPSWLLLKMSVVEMAAENFIGAVWTIYQEGSKPLAARILLLPSMIGVGCAVYAQIHYVVQSAERALQNNGDREYAEIVSYKHELQALASLLGSTMEGLKLYFTSVILYKRNALGTTLASAAAAERFVYFIMCKGHSATDVKFGNTMVGNLWYKTMLAPFMPNIKAYAASTIPLVGFIVHTQAILSISRMLQERFGCQNNYLIEVPSFTVAILSGMMEAFIGQKSFSCSKLLKSFSDNSDAIEQQRLFWYGDQTSGINNAQHLARFIKTVTNTIFFVPLSCLHGAEHLLHFSTLLIMTVIPIQVLSVFVYISRMALAYNIFYTAMHSMHEMLMLYINKDVSMSHDEQMLLSLIALPFGFSLGFAVLMACGDSALKSTNYVYGSLSQQPQTATENMPLVSSGTTQEITWRNRVAGTINFGTESINTLWKELQQLIEI